MFLGKQVYHILGFWFGVVPNPARNCCISFLFLYRALCLCKGTSCFELMFRAYDASSVTVGTRGELAELTALECDRRKEKQKNNLGS